MGKDGCIGARPCVYVAPEGLIRCAATNVNFGTPKDPKAKKSTPNATWVCCLSVQTGVADKLPIESKEKMTIPLKEARKLLGAFKKLDAEKAQEAEKICAKEKMKKTKVMKKPKAMRKSN